MTIWVRCFQRLPYLLNWKRLSRLRNASTKAPSKVPPSQKPNGTSIIYEFLATAGYCAQAALLIHIVSAYVIEVSNCGGPSMLPTLAVSGDFLVIAKWHRRGRGIVAGDVISYAHPLFPGTVAVKRVVGMPGDFVVSTWEPSVLLMQQEFSRDEASSDEGDGDQKHEGKRMIQIPEGHCWVLGDNLAESRDSRFFGPVPLALVKGKVLGRLFPWKERKWINNGFEEAEGLD